MAVARAPSREGSLLSIWVLLVVVKFSLPYELRGSNCPVDSPVIARMSHLPVLVSQRHPCDAIHTRPPWPAKLDPHGDGVSGSLDTHQTTLNGRTRRSPSM